MVCPCLAVPLLVGGAVGAARQTELVVFSLCMSIIVVIVMIFKAEAKAPCESCNAFSK